MSNTSMKLKTVERKMKDFNSSLTDFENQFVIIPFQPSGYIDYSNFGQVTNQVQIDQFETYKRLYTGNDAFIVTWKDSVNFDYSNQSPNSDTVKSITIKYSVGEVLLGWLEDSTTDNDISTDTSFSEYKSQKSITNLTLRINAAKYQLNENYSYYFYKVPEISNQILYKVSSLEKEYLGKDLMCYVLRLESLQDTLANTGRAKQQNVMPNAPGQGYLQPEVAEKEDYTLPGGAVEGTDYVDIPNRYVIANKTYQMNNPVKSIVLKLFGLAVLCNVSLIGRRAYLGGDFTQYGSPRLIFPMNFSNPSTVTIYRSQQQEVNFYWMVNGAPVINFSNEVFDALKSFLAFSKFWSQEGILTMDQAQTQATNPQINGTYGYQLYGQQTSSGYQVWMVDFDTKTIDTSYTYGCAKTYTIGGNKAIHDHMFDCYWIQKQITVLPINKSNTLNFGWTIGATYAAAVARNITTAFSLFLIGILGTLYEKVNAPAYQGVYGLIPAALCDFMLSESQITLQNSGYVRFDYFLNPDSEDLGEFASFFKTDSMNTSFQAELTDIITDGNTQYCTDQIGQTVNADGSNVKSDGTALLMDGTYTLVENTQENMGYIIDSFNIQAIFKGDFSVEFLDMNGQVVWTGVYQSDAKWAGTIREFNTWKDTSIFGRENQYLGKPLAWPKALQPLDPDTSSYILNFSTPFSLKWSLAKNSTDTSSGYGSWSRFEGNGFKTNKWNTGFTSWTGTQHTTDNGDLDLAGYLSGGNSDLGTLAINVAENNIQSFLNFYNKVKFTIQWDWSVSNDTTYATDTENFITLEFDTTAWVVESETTTDWKTIKISTSNSKIRKRIPLDTQTIVNQSENVKNDSFGYVIPGVYDYAGQVTTYGYDHYTTSGELKEFNLWGIPNAADPPSNAEFLYNIDIDLKIRLEIQSNTVVIHCMTNNNKFEWVYNGTDYGTNRRSWISGVMWGNTYNAIEFSDFGGGACNPAFQINVTNIQLIRDF